VDRLDAAAEVVVVHDVVVDQGERLDDLDRDRRGHQIYFPAGYRRERPVVGLAGLDIRQRLADQQRGCGSEPFATGFEDVSGGLVESFGLLERQVDIDRVVD